MARFTFDGVRSRGFWIQAVVSGLCLVVLVTIIDVGKLGSIFRASNLGFVVLALAIMPPAILVRALRWMLLLRARGVPITLREASELTFIGQALNLFLPASSGDIARSYYGWKGSGYKEEMLASTLADKAIALLTLAIIGVVSAIALRMQLLALVSAAMALPLLVLFIFPWLLPWRTVSKLFRRVTKRSLDPTALRDSFAVSPLTLMVGMGVSILGWILTNMVYFWACEAVYLDLSVLYVFAIAPLINLMRIVPITVGGIGSADMMIVYLFDMQGVTSESAIAVSLLVNLVLLILPAVIGAVVLMKRELIVGRPATSA